MTTSLRKNFLWTFIGNAVYAACQWAIVVVIAKAGTPEMVGVFALGTAVTAPVFIFSTLKLRSIQATDARGEFTFPHYFTLRLLTTGAALLVVIAIVFVSGYGREQRLVIFAVALAKAVETVSDVLFGALQQRERMGWISLSMIAKGVLSLVVVGGVVALSGSIVAAAMALAVSWGVVFALVDLPAGRKVLAESGTSGRIAITPDSAVLGRLLRLALPLGVVITLGSLAVNIPRYFVEHHLGARALGIYSAISYVMVAGGMVINALGQSAAPRLARNFAAGDGRAFRRLLVRLCLLGASIGSAGLLVVLVAGRPLLTLLYRPEYAEQTSLFVWLMAGQALNYTYVFLGTGVNAMRNYRIQLPIHALSTASLVATCAVLVPRHGLTGAAWAVMAGAVVEAIGYGWSAWRLMSVWRLGERTAGDEHLR
jgi:O-antigen/teichoic acid export membrane protein